MSVRTVSSQADAANPLGYEKEGKLLVGFAIPCIISMLVTSLYNIVDQIFIGQGVGLLGNAATNIAFPLSIACTAPSDTGRCLHIQQNAFHCLHPAGD